MGLVSRLGRKRSSDNSKNGRNAERSRTSGLPLRNDKYHRNTNQQYIGGIRDRFLLGAILCGMIFIMHLKGDTSQWNTIKPIAVVSLQSHLQVVEDGHTGHSHVAYDGWKKLANPLPTQSHRYHRNHHNHRDDDWDPRDYDEKNANCESLGDWQKKHYPTCNLVHENTLQIWDDKTHEKIGNGGYREVWAIDDAEQKTVVLKTLIWTQSYDTYSFNRHLQRHNRDALAMESLHSSPYVVDIYAFCANGGLYEYGNEGTLSTYRRKKNRNSRDDLKFMLQAALGLVAFHSIDDEQKSSIVHNDIKPNQFIMIDGVYKLNDFNKAKFILYDKDTKIACKTRNTVPRDSGIFRSPEEYGQERLDEKSDIYCFGNSIFMILTGHSPWKEVSDDFEVHKRVMAGERTTLPQKIIESTDPYVQVMVRVMKMSQEQDPSKRPSAKDISIIFQEALEKQ